MNLASIQKIIKLTPIPGADFLETATVLGWSVVVKKGEYKEGDLCTYIQIDTIVPDEPQFEFLRDRNFRVRSIKLRKQLSQGLIIPCPEGKWKVGDDVTDLFKIKKYEKTNEKIEQYEKPRRPKVWYKALWYNVKYNFLYPKFPFLRPKQRSPFPTNLVSITDEERIQNVPQILELYKGKEFVVSYKLDGSSITIIHQKTVFGSKYRICSRRFELHDSNNDYTKVFNNTGFKEHIDRLVEVYQTNDIIVQGEAIGKFNGNHHNLEKEEIRLFNIYVNGKRLNQKSFLNTCEFLKIPHCPEYMTTILNHTLPEILEVSKIKDVINPKVDAEGLVWRCVEDNTSFKVINNNYLISKGE